jgi:transcription elongation factor Elf1
MLVNLFGESKQGSYDNSITQYQFNCPHCAEEKGYVDNKYNLEISFAIGKFHCWACGIAGSISSLIRSKGGKEMYNEYFNIISDIKESKYYNLDMFRDNGDMFTEQYLKLPSTYKKIDLNGKIDKQLKEYLEKRKISQDIIDYYNIGRTTWEEDYSWRNRIIFPSYNSAGDLNYFIGRTYKENDKRVKYKNCDADKSQIILHEDKIQWDADIFLVEGAIDCIYYPNTISLLGKYLTPKMEIFKKLKEKAKARVIICLDGDTELKETKSIFSILNNGRLYGNVYYIRLGTEELPWKDFGEVYETQGKEGIIKAMKSMQKFSTIEMTVYPPKKNFLKYGSNKM